MAHNPRLLDTQTNNVHQLTTGAKYLIGKATWRACCEASTCLSYRDGKQSAPLKLLFVCEPYSVFAVALLGLAWPGRYAELLGGLVRV